MRGGVHTPPRVLYPREGQVVVFDAHLHLGQSAFVEPPNPGELDLPIYQNATENRWVAYARHAEKQGIFKALAFAFPFPTVAVRRANQYVIDAAARRPDLFLPLLLVSDELAYFEAQRDHIAGAKEEFYLPGGRDLRQFMPVYDFLEQNDLVLLIHPHWDDRVSRIRHIRRNFPKLRMILAHSGRKWPFFGDDVLETIVPALGKLKHLYFDTSTIRDPRVVQALAEKVGANRVIFGSDFPFYNKKNEDIYRQELDAVYAAKLPDDAKELILRGNFQSLFLGDSWSRRVSRDDGIALARLLEDITALDRKHLAIDKKLAVFRANVRAERHIFVLENRSGLLGFMRESGRHDDTAMVEEVCVHPSYRGRGYGEALLRLAQQMFAGLEAKTFAANEGMNRLLKKVGFSSGNGATGKAILLWKWSHAC